MREINSREDYAEVVEKYGARLKVARAKYEDFKKEVAALEKTLGVPAPATATEEARKGYDILQKNSKFFLKNVERFVSEYDDLFDNAARTVKLYR